MSFELISILALVVGFALATLVSVNMGMVMLAIAFLVGTTVGGLDGEEILAGFPGDILVVLVGVTFLFAIARANGTLDWLVHRAVRLIGGRIALIPWVMFTIAAVLTAIGAVSPAAVAMVAPIAMSMAAEYRINPLLMGALVIHGAQAGSFSPISVHGTIVSGVVEKSGLPAGPMVLFLASLVVNTIIAIIVFVAFGGLRLARSGSFATSDQREPATVGAHPTSSSGGSSGSSGRSDTDDTSTPSGDQPAPGLNTQRVLTLVGLAALVVATLGFGLDVGLVAVTISVLLSIASPSNARNAPSEVAWPVVLLLSGVLTYIGVLQQMGTIDYASESVAAIGIPLVVALLLCYIGGVVSAFASSTALMGALIPLTVPFLQEGSGIGAVSMVTALAVALTVVDVSPFSTNGALVLANATGFDRDALFRKLMIYGATIVITTPLLIWFVFVVIGG